ncbi:MAG: hypothetical protein LBG65_07805 [Puniceicoccales bacterium]|nr:hypothetical protein [Puniceicoccales bacterium]
MNASVDTRQLEAFQRTFERYLALRKRAMPEIALHVSRQVSIGNRAFPGLYFLALDRAPKPGQILRETRARGWRIRYRSKLAKFQVAQQIGPDRRGIAAFDKSGRSTVYRAVYGRVSKGGLIQVASQGRGGKTRFGAHGTKRGELIGDRFGGRFGSEPRHDPAAGGKFFNRRHFQVTWEIWARQRAARHVASGWLSLGRGARDAGPARLGRWQVRRRSGEAGSVEIRRDGPEGIAAILRNRTPGMAALEKKGSLVERALAHAREDMRNYIQRKEGEAMRALRGKMERGRK